MATPIESHGSLGIISGGGSLPADIAEAACKTGRKVHLVGIKGEADSSIEQYPHDWIKWGQVGRLFSILKQNDCREVVIIGKVRRPDLSSLRMDLGALKLLPFVMQLKNGGGDDSILSRIAALFEEKGHIVRSPLDVAPALAAGEKAMGRLEPGAVEMADMARGFEMIHALGPFDVGQAAVVARGHVLAIEGAEGTDAMLERAGKLRQWGEKGKAGVLVKAPKPKQDRRVDLPTIGPGTIELAQKAGLAGIGVMAGETLLAERERTIAMAEEAGLFLFGWREGGAQ